MKIRTTQRSVSNSWALTALLVLAALALAACSTFLGTEDAAQDDLAADGSEPDNSEPGSTQPGDRDPGSAQPLPATPFPEAPTVDPQPGDPAELLGPSDHIVISSSDQNLSVLTQGGIRQIPTANSASQPVFSADGSTLAWTSFLDSPETPTIVIGSVAEDGSVEILTTVKTPFMSFYTAWAPGSNSKLAVLGNAPDGVGVAVIGDELSSAILSASVPLYFQWLPSGGGLLAHVGVALEHIDIAAGVGEVLLPLSPAFNTPALTPDGGSLFVVLENRQGAEPARAVVQLEADDEGRFEMPSSKPLAAFNGFGSLLLSPDGTTLAVLVRGGDGGSVAQVGNGGRQADIPVLGEGLWTIALESGEATEVISGRLEAMFWSPNSELLLTLHPAGLLQGIALTQWKVYRPDGQIISESPPFALSPQFAGAYLPFFDQYAQSVSLWSPDSTRFTFSGLAVTGQEGVWIHKIPSQNQPPSTALVGSGTLAFWSPRDNS